MVVMDLLAGEKIDHERIQIGAPKGAEGCRPLRLLEQERQRVSCRDLRDQSRDHGASVRRRCHIFQSNRPRAFKRPSISPQVHKEPRNGNKSWVAIELLGRHVTRSGAKDIVSIETNRGGSMIEGLDHLTLEQAFKYLATFAPGTIRRRVGSIGIQIFDSFKKLAVASQNTRKQILVPK